MYGRYCACFIRLCCLVCFFIGCTSTTGNCVSFTCPGAMSVVWLYIANVWAVYGLVVGISWQIPRPWHCCTWLSWLLCSGGYDYTRTHTQPFNGPWSGTTRVGRYQKKHSPTHIHPDHRTSFINFLHLLHSIASSLFSLRARQSSLTTSVQVHIGLPLGLGPSTSYSMHFFAQSSSFRSTCPYHRSLFCCNTNAMSSIPSLSLSQLLTWKSVF